MKSVTINVVIFQKLGPFRDNGWCVFWFISFLTQSPWFYEQLGFGIASQGRLGPVLLILSVAAGAFSYWFTPVQICIF